MANEGELKLVRKAVEVLDVLSREREPTPARIAEVIGEPRSSVYRLLASLQRLDMVEPGARRGTYRLGFHLLRLGTAVVSRFDERQLALPVMERIHDETGETVFLCVRRGTQAVCIERIEGRRVQSLALTLGGALPLHAGAGSRVLLAAESREFWNEYVSSEPLERLTQSTPVTPDELFPILEDVRSSGVSVSDGDVTVGIAAVGVPIIDYRGVIRASLAISGVQQNILGAGVRNEVRRLLIDGGREVSRGLGSELANEPIAKLG
ncbi:IclR family transcriptional regulator [Mycolicibacterium septicum DSM 44393]|uniref:IclR family transcriptional regulator n=1 Tax=Mycolicibacterium septicum DSM 44393 TaxID=1341646 RepID=A0A7X6RVB7_9MYCO|nr:IclR family transcriptional regulator [Mycolicibacterium septicum]NKZ10807.1 IclR family transcriptional regulator [Mycolicibacterium septicum DSM 44393]